MRCAENILKERYRVRDVLFREKPFLGNIAPEPLLAESLASLNDAATASRFAAEIAEQVERILVRPGQPGVAAPPASTG